ARRPGGSRVDEGVYPATRSGEAPAAMVMVPLSIDAHHLSGISRRILAHQARARARLSICGRRPHGRYRPAHAPARVPGGPMRRTLLLLLLLLSAPLAAAQTLVTAVGSNPPTLDPQKTFNGFSFGVTTHVYETLFRVTTEGDIEGLLAESWEFVSPDRLRVTLHDGVAFTDGTALDAAAVKASLERLLDPATAAPGRFVVSAIQSVEV